MAIKVRISVTALVIVVTLVAGPILGQPVFAQGCGIDPQITINIGTAGVPPYTPESLGDTAFMGYAVVGGPSATLDIPVTRYLAPVDPATGRIPVVPPASDTHPPVTTFPTHLESLGILGATATLEFAYSYYQKSVTNHDKNKQHGASAEPSLPMRPAGVRFNGTDVTDRLTLTAAKTSSTRESGQVTTTLNGVLATFEMNIWEIRFPSAPGEDGHPPSPAINTLNGSLKKGQSATRSLHASITGSTAEVPYGGLDSKSGHWPRSCSCTELAERQGTGRKGPMRTAI